MYNVYIISVACIKPYRSPSYEPTSRVPPTEKMPKKVPISFR